MLYISFILSTSHVPVVMSLPDVQMLLHIMLIYMSFTGHEVPSTLYDFVNDQIN